MLVQRFETQGNRFTNFHYYYYYYTFFKCTRTLENTIERARMVTKRTGDHYVLGFAPALRFLPGSNAVQTLQTSFG